MEVKLVTGIQELESAFVSRLDRLLELVAVLADVLSELLDDQLDVGRYLRREIEHRVGALVATIFGWLGRLLRSTIFFGLLRSDSGLAAVLTLALAQIVSDSFAFDDLRLVEALVVHHDLVLQILGQFRVERVRSFGWIAGRRWVAGWVGE